MGSPKIALAAAVSVTAAMLTAGTAVASSQPPAPTPDSASAELTAEIAGAGTSTEPSPYVKASSPAQAMEILDALESPQTASPSAKAAAASVQYGPCTLYPTLIYLRTSGGLGAKPYTDCTVPVSSIRHNTDLRYQWLSWWRLAASYPGGNSGEKRYEQRNVQWQCHGTGSTMWAGTTLGTIVYGGKTYYARVYQNPTTKDCGA